MRTYVSSVIRLTEFPLWYFSDISKLLEKHNAKVYLKHFIRILNLEFITHFVTFLKLLRQVK